MTDSQSFIPSPPPYGWKERGMATLLICAGGGLLAFSLSIPGFIAGGIILFLGILLLLQTMGI